MTCEQSRDMVSARMDGELDRELAPLLEDHLRNCPRCSAYQEDAFALRRSLQIRAVDHAGDPNAAQTSPLAGVKPGRGLEALRLALFVIGATLIVLNIVSVVAPAPGDTSHLLRHEGIFGTALGIAMVAVAATPHRAIGLVPLTSAVAALMIVAAAADLIDGETRLLSEAPHLLELAGLVCLWIISGGPSRVPRHLGRLRRLTD